MSVRYEYGIRYPDQLPSESLGPFPTEERARVWVAQNTERILTRRPAGTDDVWRDAP